MAVTANLKLRDKRLISLISDLLVDQTDIIYELAAIKSAHLAIPPTIVTSNTCNFIKKIYI